jgi:carboxylesterase
MAASSATDWFNSLNEGLERLKARCDTLFVTGLSMGGTLTLLMAGQFPGLFKGIIPINAAVVLNSPDMASLAFMPGAPPEVPGVGSDIKAPGVVELAYPVVPTPAVKGLLLLMKVADELMPRITCPALIVTSRDDHVVPPVNAEYILNRLGSEQKRILWLENSYHVATLDNDKDLILQESLNFIKGLI